jgi:ActR/RegA family two-component response regulator/DNA-binding transcriptional ArsR family regulator
MNAALSTELIPPAEHARAVRILIVDDDTVFRDELATLLRDDGHTVAEVPSVRRALETLEQDEFEVVLTDLKMPRQTGLDLLRETKARWPRMYVVVITGFATVDTAIEAMKSGAFDYIRKPFEIDAIQKVLGLVGEEIRYRGRSGPVRDPARLAERWAKETNGPVLLVGPMPGRSNGAVTFLRLDPENMFRIRDAVEGFVGAHSTASVVIAGTESLFTEHRQDDVIELLRAIRQRIEGHGRLAVAVDPQKLSTTATEALRAAVAEGEEHSALDTLSNPIRRRVVRRLAEGPAIFSVAMHAAGLDDSPKFSFHLRKLQDEGFVVHVEDRYRLTEKGERAMELLGEVDRLGAAGPSETLVFTRG